MLLVTQLVQHFLIRVIGTSGPRTRFVKFAFESVIKVFQRGTLLLMCPNSSFLLDVNQELFPYHLSCS